MKAPKSGGSGHLLDAASALAPGRGRARPIDAAAVTEVALRIVDEEDLGALTMRRLAQELGVAIATVYSATGGKENILNSLVEHILGEVPVAAAESVAWDEGIVGLLTAVHEAFIAHPAVAHLALLRRVTGPTSLRIQETVVRLLRSGGLDAAAVGRAYAVLTSYVMGFTMLRISRMHDRAGVPTFSAAAFPEAAAFAPVLAEETSTAGFDRALRHLVRSFA